MKVHDALKEVCHTTSGHNEQRTREVTLLSSLFGCLTRRMKQCTIQDAYPMQLCIRLSADHMENDSAQETYAQGAESRLSTERKELDST